MTISITSNSERAALFQALSEAQGKIIDPRKDITVSGEDGDYQAAPLSKFFDNVTAQFKRHGLFYFQNLTSQNEAIGISTFIGHSSGGFIESDIYWMKIKPGEESIAIYSAKKASLCAAAGITGKNTVEAKEKPQRVVSFYNSAEERSKIKNDLLAALVNIDDSKSLAFYLTMNSKDIENLTAEDPGYTEDLLREIKAKRNQFAAEGENLKKRI